MPLDESRPTMPDEPAPSRDITGVHGQDGSSVPHCLATNEWTEWHQVIAVETGHLELLYRNIIVRTGTNNHAGEQHSNVKFFRFAASLITFA
jgi:hypothetical protein